MIFAKLLGFEYVVIGVIISAAYRTLRMAIYCSKKLGYGRFVIADMIKWLVIIIAVSAVVVVLTPATTGIAGFMTGCLFVFIITVIMYGMAAFVLIPGFKSKLIKVLKR